jgi:LPXTG-site transpeptidase (sortase) family protein
MTIRFNNYLILLGICLAFFGAARAAPNIVKAFSEPPGSAVSVPPNLSWNGEIQPLLPSHQIDYELEPVEGLSMGFTARIVELNEVPPVTSIGRELQEEQKLIETVLVQEEPPAEIIPAVLWKPGEAPVRLIIPSIYLDAPVVLSHAETVQVRGGEYLSWNPPDDYAIGWHDNSALLGEPGNTVLNGHHNIHGEVFRNLIDVEIGDTIVVLGPTQMYLYVVANKLIVPEKYEQIDTRMENARWILGTEDERLTLITCWPYETNTHRLILVASPLE